MKSTQDPGIPPNRVSAIPLLQALSAIVLLLALTGCGEDFTAAIAEPHAMVGQQLERLGKTLDNEELTNALLLKTYADRLSQSQPDLAPIATALKRDATRDGKLYQNLLNRYKAVPTSIASRERYVAAYQELQSLQAGSDPIIFNDALLDLVNTLADLSGGTLNRINIPNDSSNTTLQGKQVAGSYLIGNPNYGEYRQDSHGNSFWEWYGQYALFSSLLGGRGFYDGAVNYNSWNRQPRYSWYNDYGRSSYGSERELQRDNTLKSEMKQRGYQPAQPQKRYGSVEGSKRASTYTTRKTDFQNRSGIKTGSGDGPRHYDSPKPQPQKKSGTTPPKRSSSLFSSSTRNSSRTSRGAGGFGGK
ncbi:MAG: hypothetical protein HQL48_02010 [Gammaproteobacteria bacterium]|nr:hypothetical protein [Gammaproteobacteria bacterium]